jgi:hypothetical protein
LFSSGSFFNYGSGPNFWRIFGEFFSTEKDMYQLRRKEGWARFWAIFAQTHLVTLSPSERFNS